MRVAFAVLMTAVAALKISDEGAGEDWELASDVDDAELDDILCWTEEDGQTVCADDKSSLDSLADENDLVLAQ